MSKRVRWLALFQRLVYQRVMPEAKGSPGYEQVRALIGSLSTAGISDDNARG